MSRPGSSQPEVDEPETPAISPSFMGPIPPCPREKIKPRVYDGTVTWREYVGQFERNKPLEWVDQCTEARLAMGASDGRGAHLRGKPDGRTDSHLRPPGPCAGGKDSATNTWQKCINQN